MTFPLRDFKCQLKSLNIHIVLQIILTMNFLELMKRFPNVYRLSKIWEYNYDQIMYYGSGNASGKLRFTNHHHPDDSVRN